jgi:bacillithiol system protein YtxJ
MGFFDSVKSIFSSDMPDFWTILDEPSEVKRTIRASNESPQLIYKHSHRCATCFFAKKQVEEVAHAVADEANLYFVDVIRSRPVSNTIAEELEVPHESPQLILLNAGKVQWHESHGAITSEAILAALKH